MSGMLRKGNSSKQWMHIKDLRISGDGSKVFCMTWDFIYAWYIETGDVMGKVELEGKRHVDTFLTVDNSKVWVNFLQSYYRVGLWGPRLFLH